MNPHEDDFHGGERINEAELANVSGGSRNVAMEAMDWCLVCDRRGICGNQGMHKLTDYLRRHGPIKSYTECPLYQEA